MVPFLLSQDHRARNVVSGSYSDTFWTHLPERGKSQLLLYPESAFLAAQSLPLTRSRVEVSHASRIISLDVVLRQRIRGLSAFHTVSTKVQVDEHCVQQSQGSKGEGRKWYVCRTAVLFPAAPFGGFIYMLLMGAVHTSFSLLSDLLQLSHPPAPPHPRRRLLPMTVSSISSSLSKRVSPIAIYLNAGEKCGLSRSLLQAAQPLSALSPL